METEQRANKNRGFKHLDVWKDSIELYILSCKLLGDFPYDKKRTVGNVLDACHSISRNIAEGYCRRSRKEYLNFLNYALGSSGEFHSSMISFYMTGLISDVEYEEIDKLHFKLENRLLRLISSLSIK